VAFRPIQLTGETRTFDAGNVALQLVLDRTPSSSWAQMFDTFNWEMVIGQVALFFPKVHEDGILIPPLPNDQLYRELFKRIQEAIDRTNETQAHIGESEPEPPESVFSKWWQERQS
jgi:hypothetical protein